MRKFQKQKLANLIKKSVPKPLLRLDHEGLDRLSSFSQVLLGMLTATSVITVSAVAPNALRLLGSFLHKKGRNDLDYRQKEQKLVQTFYYLKGKGHITLEADGEDYKVLLTEKGKSYFNQLTERVPSIPRPHSWDGKFWQIAADIPAGMRNAADAFRRKVLMMRLFPLQRTLWLYPYDPRHEIGELADLYHIERFVTVMKIEILDPKDKRVLEDYYKKIGVI